MLVHRLCNELRSSDRLESYLGASHGRRFGYTIFHVYSIYAVLDDRDSLPLSFSEPLQLPHKLGPLKLRKPEDELTVNTEASVPQNHVTSTGSTPRPVL